MARTLAVPVVRAATQPAVTGWAAATLAGASLLPWHRTGRDLGAWVADSIGVHMAVSSPLAAAVLGFALLALVASLWPAPERQRGVAVLMAAVSGS